MRTATALTAILFATSPVHAQSTTLVSHGDPSTRIDVVFRRIQEIEWDTFVAACDSAIEAFRIVSPFREYYSYFNFHRVTSDVTEAPDVDLIVSFTVTGRSEAVLGGGDAHVMVDAPYVTRHEFGHAMPARLWDESWNGDAWDVTLGEPSSPNVSTLTGDNLKWVEWIDPGTSIPTPATYTNTRIGMFEGAGNHRTGLFRPAYACQMGGYGPFCAVCRQALIRSLYQYEDISPVNWSWPSREVTAGRGSTAFVIGLKRPTDHRLRVVGWYVDRVLRQSGGLWFIQNTRDLSAGEHDVEVRIEDRTSHVRRDPLRTMTSFLTWTLLVTGGVPVDRDPSVEPRTAVLGEPLAFEYAGTLGITPFSPIEWDFGDGTTASGRTVSHAFHDLGRFWVLLKVRNSWGVQGIERHPIDVQLTGSGSVGVTAANDDGYEVDSTGTLHTAWSGQNRVGLGTTSRIRFAGISIPPTARLDSARLRIHPRAGITTTAEGGIDAILAARGELSPDAREIYSYETGAFRAQTPTSALKPFLATFYPGSDGNRHFAGRIDVREILQEIVAQSEWTSGNAVALQITNGWGSSSALIGDVEHPHAPELAWSYRMASSDPTVAIVDDIPSKLGTTSRTVSFLARAYDLDGTIESVSWAFGDDTADFGSRQTHTYASAGTYTVRVWVRDNDGNGATASKRITVGLSRRR